MDLWSLLSIVSPNRSRCSGTNKMIRIRDSCMCSPYPLDCPPRHTCSLSRKTPCPRGKMPAKIDNKHTVCHEQPPPAMVQTRQTHSKRGARRRQGPFWVRCFHFSSLRVSPVPTTVNLNGITSLNLQPGPPAGPGVIHQMLRQLFVHSLKQRQIIFSEFIPHSLLFFWNSSSTCPNDLRPQRNRKNK